MPFEYYFGEGKSMHKQIGKIGAIRRELEGKACPSCGSQKYQLVLRRNMHPQAGGLFARCSQCQRPRGLNEDLGRLLWM
jgi:ssDNA-binding Zn-finger/Zn-ribbon topoisomerase 1